ncbi:unnamed protein product [Penicillium bialowiezense]
MSTGKASADAAQDAARERMVQALMLADLGSDRRDKCTTADTTRARANAASVESQRLFHVEGSAAQRRFEMDEAQLNRWNSLHETISDTTHMESLPDIAAGQTHRAALTASMRALEIQRAQRGGHGFGGRGGGIVGSRGRGSSSSHVRTTSMGAIVSSGRPGPPHRSATLSFGLDPALNSNNNPNESDARNRGRGSPRGSRGQGRARGKQQSLPRSPMPPPPELPKKPHQRSSKPPPRSPPKRPQRPEINFSSNLVDPTDFMAGYRRSLEVTAASVPNQAPAPPQIPTVSASLPLAQAEKNTKTSVHAAVQPKAPKPVVSVSVTPVVKPVEVAQSKTPAATPGSVVVGHMGTHEVKTPTPPSKPIATRKILPLKKPRLGRLTTPSKIVQPPDIGPPHKEIEWNISPGEFPRIKESVKPVAPAANPKAASDGKAPIVHTPKKQNAQDKSHIGPKSAISENVSQSTPAADAAKAKKSVPTGDSKLQAPRTPKSQKVQDGSLLDSANSPLSTQSPKRTPIKPMAHARKGEAVPAAPQQKNGKPITPRTPKSEAARGGSLLDTANSPLSTQPLKNLPIKPKDRLENDKAEYEQIDTKPPASVASNPRTEDSKDTHDTPSGSLLDMANHPIDERALQIPLSATTPVSKAFVAKSPGTTDLIGLDFAPDESPKSIDAVLFQAKKRLTTSDEAEFERRLAERVEAEVAIRLKQARDILKRPSEHARFQDWLGQADHNEASVIQEALRKASFTGYRSPVRAETETDSSNETTPEGKLKALLQTHETGDEFMNRFPVPGISTSDPPAADVTSKMTSAPVHVVAASTQTIPAPVQAIPAPTKAIPAPVQVIPAPVQVIPAPTKAIPAPVQAIPAPVQVTTAAATLTAVSTNTVPAKAVSKARPLPPKQSLFDSIYANQPQQAAPAPRLFSGNIPKPKDPKAAGVQLVGPTPFNPQKKFRTLNASNAQAQSENIAGAASVESDPSRVKVIGVQPYVARK